jgi:F0F1-type ATP synthase assembly protein I
MAVIDSKKLLPPSKESSAIEKPKFLVPVKSISVKKITGSDLKPVDKKGTDEPGSLVLVKKKIISLSKIINNNLLLDQREASTKRKEEEKSRREQKEKKLEEKVKKNNIKSDFIGSIPGQSIFDRINRFIGFTLLGYLFNQYGELLPKLMEFGKVLEPVGKFVEGFAKNLLQGVVDFIDRGYKAYDQTRDFVKQIGGEGAQKTFDEFSKNLNVVLNGAIGAAMLIASTAPKTPGGSAGGVAAGAAAGIGGRYGYTPEPLTPGVKPSTIEGRAITKAQREAARNAEKATRRNAAAALRRGITTETTEQAAKQVATQGAKQSLKSLVAVPVIGSLIGFIIDTVVFREKPSRAAAGAVGSAIGQGIGIALAGGTTFGLGAGVGMFVGGFAGDWIGKALYDTVVGYNTKPVQAKAQGGTVSGRNQSLSKPSRRLKTIPRKTPPKIQSQKTQPGKDSGGKLRIEELYGTDEPGKRSALRALKRSSEDVKKMRSINGLAGAMFGAGIDMTLGQKPDKKLARSIGDVFGSVVENAVNMELNNSFGDISKTIAMANGGSVPTKQLGSGLSIGERIGRFISNALAISIESSASRIIQNLNSELNLEGGPAGSPPGTGGDGGPDVFHGRGAERMWNFFKNKGLSDFAVAGILGNAHWESSFNPTARGKGMGPGGSDAIGIFQWGETERWKTLVNWAKQQNLNPWDYDTQLKFAWHEMQTTEKATIPALQSATSASDAAEKFRSVYERSRNTEQRRKDTAEGYYKEYKGKTYIPPTPKGGSTGYKPRSPGPFNAIEYITGDSTQGSNYDEKEHGGSRYHEHIAFATQADKERAKAALRAKGFTIGSEYRPGDRGYHGSGLAFDVPFYPNNRLGYSDDKKGEQRFSKDVRRILGIDGGSSSPSSLGRVLSSTKVNGAIYTVREGGKYYKNGKEITEAEYDKAFGLQLSLAPNQSSSTSYDNILETDTSDITYYNNSVAFVPIEVPAPVV